MFLFILFVSGCSPTIYSDNFIIDSEKIDKMSIGVTAYEGEVFHGTVFEAGDRYNIEIKNEEQVKPVLNILKGIEVKELSLKRAQKILKSRVFISKC